MYNIAIIEDEKSAADCLTRTLKDYGDAHGERFNVYLFTGAVKFLDNYDAKYDIVFMDIELPDMNGMEASRWLRERDKDVLLIFVTNMAQYAVKGYEVRAFDFIVKPINYYNFAAKLSAALDYLAGRSEKYIWVVNREKRTRVSASDIKYVEIRSHTLNYHTTDGEVTATGSLSKVEEQLAGLPFAMCNRCFLVNLKYVTSVKDMSVFLGDEELQISHIKRPIFMKALTDYCAAL